MGVLQREQLLRFFSDENDPGSVSRLLKKLENYSFIRYDSEADRYAYNSADLKVDEIRRRVIRAFWVVAQCGSREVLQLFQLDYPSQIMFITAGNIPYEITVCYSENDAMLTERTRRLHAVSGERDCVNHVAVVPDRELGERLGKYGFDCWCTLDPESRIPHYELCGEGRKA